MPYIILHTFSLRSCYHVCESALYLPQFCAWQNFEVKVDCKAIYRSILFNKFQTAGKSQSRSWIYYNYSNQQSLGTSCNREINVGKQCVIVMQIPRRYLIKSAMEQSTQFAWYRERTTNCMQHKDTWDSSAVKISAKHIILLCKNRWR